MKIKITLLVLAAAGTILAGCEQEEIGAGTGPSGTAHQNGSGTGPGKDTNPGTGTETGSETGIGTNTGTNAGTNTGTGDWSQGQSTTLATVKDMVAGMYPGSRIVEIDVEHYSIEIDIIDGYTPREVLFSREGEWIRTETELRRSDLPAAVTNALAASQWAAWRVDDASYFETLGGNYYLLEVESGHRESRVKFDTNGNVLP